jgi:2-methylcitrate dehydratase PrpD
VSVSFAEGKAFLQQYSDEKLRDPLIKRLSEMVEIDTIEGLPRDVSCRMEIVLRDGSQYVSQVDYPKGSIENPMTPQEKREKFTSLSSDILDGRTRRRIEETVFRIEKVKDVSKLMDLVVRKR